MKILLQIASIVLIVSCNAEAPTELVQIKYNDATFLAELDMELYLDVHIVDSEFWGVIGKKDKIEMSDIYSNDRHVWGSTGYGPGEFINIHEVSYSDNKIFILDLTKKTIEVFDRNLVYLKTVNPETNILSIVAESDSSFYALSFGMSQLGMLRYSGTNFSNVEYIYVESTRNPEDGVAIISLSNNHLLLSRLMTNKLTIINTQTNSRVTATNDLIPARPNYQYVGEYRVPTKVIWDWGLISDSSVYQLLRESESSTIYRFGLDGKMNKIYNLDFQAIRMIKYNDSYLFVTPNSLIKYPKSIF
jgi:hypothetical protein